MAQDALRHRARCGDGQRFVRGDPSTSNSVIAGVGVMRSTPAPNPISPVTASSSSSDQPAASRSSG
ncbi:hypothetical protein P0F65_17830 [Sphingomonas sp. I4]